MGYLKPNTNNNMPLSELFGPTLKTKEGDKPTDEVLAGKKHVLVYFSAHWCPPCRGYTPDLSKAYADSAKKDETAVVFISSDQDQASFDEYYGEMSFFAVCTPSFSFSILKIVSIVSMAHTKPTLRHRYQTSR